MVTNKNTQRFLVCFAAVSVIGFTCIGCNKTEPKPAHDPKTDISAEERKDKQGEVK